MAREIQTVRLGKAGDTPVGIVPSAVLQRTTRYGDGAGISDRSLGEGQGYPGRDRAFCRTETPLEYWGSIGMLQLIGWGTLGDRSRNDWEIPNDLSQFPSEILGFPRRSRGENLG